MPEITRRQLKLMRQAKEQAGEKKKKGLNFLAYIGVGALLIIAVWSGTGYLASRSKQKDAELGVETFTDMGRDHIPDTDPKPDYNSNPPTSGNHWAQPAQVAIYDTELPDQRVVHNLEHGHIWISYNCQKLKSSGFIGQAWAHGGVDDGHKDASVTQEKSGKEAGSITDDPACMDLKKQLEDLATKLNVKVLLTPRVANEHLISVAGWTKLMHQDSFDEKKIEEFYKLYKDKGLEFFPDSADQTVTGKL